MSAPLLPKLPRAGAERWIQIFNAVVGGTVLALLTFFGSQAIETRDGVKELRSTVPLHFQAVELRLTTAEAHLTALEANLQTETNRVTDHLISDSAKDGGK